MKAYTINDADIYAAKDETAALDLHVSLTGDGHGDCEVKETALSMKVVEEDENEELVGVRTIGDILAEMPAPGYIATLEE